MAQYEYTVPMSANILPVCCWINGHGINHQSKRTCHRNLFNGWPFNLVNSACGIVTNVCFKSISPVTECPAHSVTCNRVLADSVTCNRVSSTLVTRYRVLRQSPVTECPAYSSHLLPSVGTLSHLQPSVQHTQSPVTECWNTQRNSRLGIMSI
jgi:hypothetical protein